MDSSPRCPHNSVHVENPPTRVLRHRWQVPRKGRRHPRTKVDSAFVASTLAGKYRRRYRSPLRPDRNAQVPRRWRPRVLFSPRSRAFPTGPAHSTEGISGRTRMTSRFPVHGRACLPPFCHGHRQGCWHPKKSVQRRSCNDSRLGLPGARSNPFSRKHRAVWRAA